MYTMMRACTILPLLCLATAAPEGLLGLGLLPFSSPMDPLAFLGQLLSTAMQAVGDLHGSLTSPSSSLPAYNNSVYSQQGEVVELGSGLRIYTVGEAGDKPCVIWNHDMQGFNGGRTRERCDQLAAQGFLVILPDYFHGEEAKHCSPGDFLCWAAMVPFTVKHYNWTRLEADWVEVKAWAEGRGAARFASVGVCGGSYITLRLSSQPGVVAGVSIHPSHPAMMPNLGEDEATIVAQVAAPQLILPTKTDSDNVKPGGLDEATLTAKGVGITIEPFLTMDHGFLTRGDMADPGVARDVARAMNLTIGFLSNH